MKMNNLKMNKRGISEIISYVLLIVLAVGLATATYYFLLQQTNIMPADVCPDGISITVENYTCNSGMLNLTLKNSGRFDVGGVRIKIVNDTTTDFEYEIGRAHV
jgi:FlaG/FlaF family flagellin (archaellin)